MGKGSVGVESPRGMGTAMVTVGMSTALVGVAVVLMATAISTDHWIDTYVPSTVTIPAGYDSDSPAFKPHFQGLFCTCYTAGNLAKIQTEGRNKVACGKNTSPRDMCVAEDAYDKFKVKSPRPDTDYIYRANFLRAVLGCLAAALVLGLLAMMIGLVVLCRQSFGCLAVAATLAILAAIACGLTVGLFWHGVYLTQNNKLTAYYEFPAFAKKTTALYDVIVARLSWSFIIACVAAGLLLLAAFILFTAMCCMASARAGGAQQGHGYGYRDHYLAQQPPAQDIIRAPTHHIVQPEKPVTYPYYIEGRPPVYSPQQPVVQKSKPWVPTSRVNREPEVSMIPARINNGSNFDDAHRYKGYSESLGEMHFD